HEARLVPPRPSARRPCPPAFPPRQAAAYTVPLRPAQPLQSAFQPPCQSASLHPPPLRSAPTPLLPANTVPLRPARSRYTASAPSLVAAFRARGTDQLEGRPGDRHEEDPEQEADPGLGDAASPREPRHPPRGGWPHPRRHALRGVLHHHDYLLL